MATTAAPTWNDIYQRYLTGPYAAWQQSRGANPTDIQAWNTDDSSRQTKLALDQEYRDALAQYNQQNGTNVQPDASMLGADVQPNKATWEPGHGGWLENNLGITPAMLALGGIGLATGGFGLLGDGGLLSSGAAAGSGAGAAAGAAGGMSASDAALAALSNGSWAADPAVASALGGGAAAGGGAASAALTGGTTASQQSALNALSNGSWMDTLAPGAKAAAQNLGGSGLSGLLGNLGSGSNLATIAGGLLGGLSSSQDKTASTNSTREPWGPAQDLIKRTIADTGTLNDYYQQNPFNAQQKVGMQNTLTDADNFRSNILPGLLSYANGMQSGQYTRKTGGAPGSGAGYGGAVQPGGYQAGAGNMFSAAPTAQQFGLLNFDALNPFKKA